MPQIPTNSETKFTARWGHWVRCLWVASALLLTLAPAVGAVEAEHWYVIELAGQRAGWMVERQTTRDGLSTTQSESELRIHRGGTELVLNFSSQFVETTAGKPVSMRSVQRFGQQPMILEATFDDEGVIEKTVQGEATHQRRLPAAEEGWLTPAVAQRALVKALATGAGQLRYRTIDPLSGLTPIEVEAKRTHELADGTTRWRVTVSNLAGLEEIVEYDAEGTTLRSTASLIGMELTYRLSDRATAQADGGGAPELLVNSLIHPDRPIARPRGLRRAVYRLSLPSGELADLPTVASQRVVRAADGSLEVKVNVSEEAQNSPNGLPRESPNRSIDRQLFLRASAYLDYRAKAVQATLAAVEFPATEGEARNDRQRAELLRRHVHQLMTRKNLAIGFASASEAAASRSGDCTEHAVLLSALLRADGIPARVVSGLLYVERFAGERQVFGYHLWSQGWIEGRWVDLDAMTAAPFDATHIALTTSALDSQEDFVAISASLLPLMGALRIEVVELERPRR